MIYVHVCADMGKPTVARIDDAQLVLARSVGRLVNDAHRGCGTATLPIGPVDGPFLYVYIYIHIYIYIYVNMYMAPCLLMWCINPAPKFESHKLLNIRFEHVLCAIFSVCVCVCVCYVQSLACVMCNL